MSTITRRPPFRISAPKPGSVWLRAKVWLTRQTLDQRLAEGESPLESPALARRAEQLVSARCLRSLAAGLGRVIADAERPLRTLSATAPLQRAEIARNRHGLEALAAVLETGDPLPVRGTAAVQLFLTHAESPLYTPSAANALEDAIARSQAALLEG